MPAVTGPGWTKNEATRTRQRQASGGDPVPWCGRACYDPGVFIRDLVTALNDGKVPYCLVGGVAVNLHGVPRMTYDVDIAVRLELVALQACEHALTSLGLLPRVPVQLSQFANDSFGKAWLWTISSQ